MTGKRLLIVLAALMTVFAFSGVAEATDRIGLFGRLQRARTNNLNQRALNQLARSQAKANLQAAQALNRAGLLGFNGVHNRNNNFLIQQLAAANAIQQQANLQALRDFQQRQALSAAALLNQGYIGSDPLRDLQNQLRLNQLNALNFNCR